MRSLVLTLFLSLLVLGCIEREASVSVASLLAAEDPDQETWNPVFLLSDGGMPRIHMRARYMARYEKTDSTYMILSGTADQLERVRVDLFDEAGDSSAVVFADRLTYYDRERRFVAKGNVTVTTAEGEYLESEHLAWSERDGKVSTPGFVRYTSDEGVVSGYEFEANDDLTNKKLKRGIAVLQHEE